MSSSPSPWSSPNPWRRFSGDIETEDDRINARRKTKKRIIIIALSFIVFVAAVSAAVAHSKATGVSKDKRTTNGVNQTLRDICAVTLYPEACFTSLAPYLTDKHDGVNIHDVYEFSVRVAASELSAALSKFGVNGEFKDVGDRAAVQSCDELLSLSMDHLNRSLGIFVDQEMEIGLIDDSQTWLSAAATYQQTCIEGFENVTDIGTEFEAAKNLASSTLRNSSEYTSNSLAITTVVEDSIRALGGSPRRRTMSSPEGWLSTETRRILSENKLGIMADVVVAQDSSGNFTTINGALGVVPRKSEKRFVIYVKRGVYNENVKVEKSMWNVMMIGDGMDVTIVSAGLNFVDGVKTYHTATFAVSGSGFIGRDMGFRNTAGAAKHQAVALMSTADKSVFYRCKIEGYQDTLYAHANRQFYRDCVISGTIDFIFGNSAVVLQNCTILSRKPMADQRNTITAQGKFDPNQNTGFSIQNCSILEAENLTGVETYLGRPWRNHSTTVIMQSEIGSLVDPKGWVPCVVGTTAPNTTFYGEYENWGPGANTTNRIKWDGLKLNLNDTLIQNFTVASLIKGDAWLPSTGVPFKPTLL